MAGRHRTGVRDLIRSTPVRSRKLILGSGLALALSVVTGGAHAVLCNGRCKNQSFTSNAPSAGAAPGPSYASMRRPPAASGPEAKLAAATPVAQQARTMPPPVSQFVKGKTIVSQIHNAPGWRPHHTYAYHAGPFTRVLNGPGWDAASHTYKPGRTLDAYQLVSRGSCRSGRHGGPTGTGTDIVDGTCHWEYLSSVDYISITGWAFDNRRWIRGTAYRYGDYVTSDSPLRAYEQVNASGCTSTVAPTGTSGGSGSSFTTPDGCTWTYWAQIRYSSEKSYIPTQRYRASSTSAATDELTANYQADLWNDREYVAGRHGEAVPIRLQAHFDYTHDAFPYSPEGNSISHPFGSHHIIVTTAPGESFADSLQPRAPLSGYAPANGVAIRNPSWQLSDGFELRDNNVDLIGLQIKSNHGIGIGGGETHGGNTAMVEGSIVDGGRGTNNPAIFLDTAMVVANSLVVTHGLLGIQEDYPGTILNSTLVDANPAPDSIGIEVGLDWMFVGETISNTAIFGFAHAAGSTGNPKATDWRGMTWLGGHNATDAPVGDSGSLNLGRQGTATARALPGTTYGESGAAAFAAFPGDYRLRKGSPLIGAGSAFGPFNPACLRNKPCQRIYTLDSPDIIGTTRPQAGRYDIGAWQSGATASRGRHGPGTAPRVRRGGVSP